MEFAPSASVALLKKRARVAARVREFFQQRQVLQVDVPVLGHYPVTDPHLENLHCEHGGETWYLQTSPEYYMKRLLAAGSGSIYYLGPAFRREEKGRLHRTEFTLLEWYRCGFDDRQLRGELTQLIEQLLPDEPVQEYRYAALFREHLRLCPHRASTAELAALARERTGFQGELLGKSAWLDLLFSHCIEPHLPRSLTFVCDYPQEQAALARIVDEPEGYAVAKRFELYWRGIELANGYWELCDPAEQRQRFAADIAYREQTERPTREADPYLLAALEAGLPDCSGVALGFDRLLMALADEDTIAAVVPFAEG